MHVAETFGCCKCIATLHKIKCEDPDNLSSSSGMCSCRATCRRGRGGTSERQIWRSGDFVCLTSWSGIHWPGTDQFRLFTPSGILTSYSNRMHKSWFTFKAQSVPSQHLGRLNNEAHNFAASASTLSGRIIRRRLGPEIIEKARSHRQCNDSDYG